MKKKLTEFEKRRQENIEQMERERQTKELAAKVVDECDIPLFLTFIKDKLGKGRYSIAYEVEEFCKNLLEINGAFVIKPQSIADAAKIEEFTDQLYPYNFQKEAALQLF
jgi:hypothetical protein